MAIYNLTPTGKYQGDLINAILDLNTVCGGSNSAQSITTPSAMLTTMAQCMTHNLGNKNIGSVTASDTSLRISTAGDFAIGSLMYTKAASSAAFTFAGTNLTSSQACKFLLCIDANGSTTAVQGNIAATSAACSLPALPANLCPLGMTTLVAGATALTLGTTTFSQTVSAGGSVVTAPIFQVGLSAV